MSVRFPRGLRHDASQVPVSVDTCFPEQDLQGEDDPQGPPDHFHPPKAMTMTSPISFKVTQIAT